MKVFSKFTHSIRGFGLLLCLLLGVTLAFAQSVAAAPENVLGTVENNGIKLTINNYTISNYGQEMMVHYTVETNAGYQMDGEGAMLIKSPEITIGDTRVQGKDAGQKKINSQKFQGAIKVTLPQYRPAISDASIYTDSILNQKGEWAINFQIKK